MSITKADVENTSKLTLAEVVKTTIETPKIEIEQPYDTEGQTIAEFLEAKNINIEKVLWVPLLQNMNDLDFEEVITSWKASDRDLERFPRLKKISAKGRKNRQYFNEDHIDIIRKAFLETKDKGFLIQFDFLIDDEELYLGRRVKTIYTETMDLLLNRVMEIYEDEKKNG